MLEQLDCTPYNKIEHLGSQTRGIGELCSRMICICWEPPCDWQENCGNRIQALQGYNEDKKQEILHFRRVITVFIHPIHSPIILDVWKADNNSFPRPMSASHSFCFCCSHGELLCSFFFYQLHLQLVTLQLIQIVVTISVPRYQCINSGHMEYHSWKIWRSFPVANLAFASFHPTESYDGSLFLLYPFRHI